MHLTVSLRHILSVFVQDATTAITIYNQDSALRMAALPLRRENGEVRVTLPPLLGDTPDL
jgi:hypothetical protein